MPCGAVEQFQSVCIDVASVDPIGPSTTSVWLSLFYTTTTTRAFDDTQTMTATGKIVAAWNYDLNTPDGTVNTRISQTGVSLPVIYGGGNSYSFTAAVSGQYLGGTPEYTYTYTVPARPPSPASAPGLAVSAITQTSAYITVSPSASNGGSAIDGYYVDVDDDPNYGSATVFMGSGTVSGLVPGTLYYVRCRAHNGAGWGAFASTTFTTLSGGMTKVSGAWRMAAPRVKVSGAWKTAAVWKKVNGKWVK
jgi:hypothetical protein